MDNETIKAIADLKFGEVYTVDLKCGTTLTVVKHVGGFKVHAKDPMRFCTTGQTKTWSEPELQAVGGPGFSSCELKMWIGEEAIPVLRALLCGLSHNIKQEGEDEVASLQK